MESVSEISTTEDTGDAEVKIGLMPIVVAQDFSPAENERTQRPVSGQRVTWRVARYS
jgi:hypothetical protein